MYDEREGEASHLGRGGVGGIEGIKGIKGKERQTAALARRRLLI